MTEDRRDVQVTEARTQALLQLQAPHKGLKEDKPAVRRQGLLFEAEGGSLWTLRWTPALLCFI